MIFGYHINGLPGMALDKAVELLDEAGYGSIALPVGMRFFDPTQLGTSCSEAVEGFARELRERNMGSVIEVEWPQESGDWSLITPALARRLGYLKLCEHAIDVAATLHSDCVVLRSGSLSLGSGGEEGPDEDGPEAAWGRLVDSLGELLNYAEERDMPIGFEPSLGMLVDTTDAFNRLAGQLPSGMLQLSLDLATLYFMGETPLAHFLHAWSGRLVNLYFCDVQEAVPQRRLMLGAGEIDFPPLFVALDEAGYSGGVHVRFDDPPQGGGSEQMTLAMRFLRKAARFHL